MIGVSELKRDFIGQKSHLKLFCLPPFSVPPMERSVRTNMGVPTPSSRSTPRPSSVRRKRPSRDEEDPRLGISSVAFQVLRVSSTASVRGTSALTDYSKRSCWESYARQDETVVLALGTKTLLSEICFLNKNACTVTVSIAVEDRPRTYITVHHKQHLPHAREVRLKVGFFPCCFVKFEFHRRTQSSIAIYGIQVRGVPSRDIERESGPSLCNLLSHNTEHLLFGPSLPLSLPYQDCLSDELSGSPEWMERQRPYMLDERIARLEQSLFSSSLTFKDV